MADLSAEAALASLDTRLVGRNLIYSPELPSTNDEVRRLAGEGAPDGTVVAADHQTAGRGRQGRRWIAPPGSSLLFSILFRPMLQPRQAQRLTMICGLAVLDALQENAGVRAGLKWPNDILYREEKLGGILAELHASGDRVDYVVVGIGLNVNLDPPRLPEGLLVPATSLSAILGRPVARIPLLTSLLRAVDTRYLDLQAGWLPHQEWARHLVTLGQPVKVTSGSSSYSGIAHAVDDDGALLVRTADGQLRAVSSADVTLRSQDPVSEPRRRERL